MTFEPGRGRGGVVDFTVLGPVGLVVEGARQGLARAQNRGVLGLVALHVGRTLSRSSIAEAIWGGVPPPTAHSQIQGAIHAIRSRLRQLGQPDVIASDRVGYRLTAAPEHVDSERFAQRIREARAAIAAGEQVAGAAALRAGLALWQGPALHDAAGAFVEAARARLVEQQLTAWEELADAELALGGAQVVVDELWPVVDTYPIREQLRMRLMRALAATGRRVEALQTFRDYRQLLIEREGLDPGSDIERLNLAILRSDDGVLAARSDPPPSELRRTEAHYALSQHPMPAQLPHDVAGFTGRATDLQWLADVRQAHMEGVAVAVVTGLAGVGKPDPEM